MPRTKVFWETKREAALEHLCILQEKSLKLERDIKQTKAHLRRLKKRRGKSGQKGVLRIRLRMREREYHQLQRQTKTLLKRISYYEERVNATPKSLWQRLDTLRL